jgi:formylglycine-generating enzyme required for sulfatase activity
VTYDVYFGTNSNPTTREATTQSGKSINRSNLLIGTTYYWKVVAKDSKGATTEGPVWRFTTQSNRAPNAPSNPSPTNHATNQPLTVTLSWDCSDPDGDAVTYDVYFGTNSNPTTREATNRSGRTLNRSNLSYGTTYYWKVVAKDSKGATTEGPEWRFTTQSAPTASSYTPSSIVPSMVLVEKGSFTMGDEFGDLWDSSRPTHKVTLTYDFYIGKYEVTFDEYDAFCNATGRSKAHDRGWGRGSRPVINVSWWDAIAYCNWLSEKEKLPKAYDNNGNLLDKDGRVTTDPSKVVGYRFPTEAEWEYAARGGNKSKGYKYSGSDNIDEVAWYWDNSGLRTQEVGKKAPNELGIYDMSGNVWEWCSDWYGSYSSSAQTNPYNNSGSDRVFRGGSWGSSATYVRVAFRDGSSPTNSLGNLGFRIARTVP